MTATAHIPANISRRAFLAGMGLAGAGLLAGCTGGAPNKAAAGTLPVTTTIYPLYDFATKVGGEHVSVTNLVPAGTEPHDWEPSPTDLAALQGSKVFAYNGAGMESWVDDALGSVDASSLKVVEASEGVDLLAIDQEHAHEGHKDHDHGNFDPHVWLDPLRAKREMENIAAGLATADPAHKDAYEAAREKWSAEFEKLDGEYRAQLAGVSSHRIVVSHEAFGYLCNAYGLEQLAITGMDAEGEPDAQAMAQIIDQVKSEGVKVIFGEELVSKKVAEAIASATGATVEVLNPIEGLTQEQIDAGEDYFSVMRSNLKKLVEALA